MPIFGIRCQGDLSTHASIYAVVGVRVRNDFANLNWTKCLFAILETVNFAAFLHLSIDVDCKFGCYTSDCTGIAFGIIQNELQLFHQRMEWIIIGHPFMKEKSLSNVTLVVPPSQQILVLKITKLPSMKERNHLIVLFAYQALLTKQI